MPYDKVACWVAREAEQDWAHSEYEHKARPLRDLISSLEGEHWPTPTERSDLTKAKDTKRVAKRTRDRRLEKADERYASHRHGSPPTPFAIADFIWRQDSGEFGFDYLGPPHHVTGYTSAANNSMSRQLAPTQSPIAWTTNSTAAEYGPSQPYQYQMAMPNDPYSSSHTGQQNLPGSSNGTGDAEFDSNMFNLLSQFLGRG